MNENVLKKKIMRKVYLIWFGRKVLPYLLIEILFFAGFLYLIGRQVYVANVIQYASSVLAANMAHPANFVSFALDVFLRTELGVQISVLGALLMVVFVFRDLIASAVQLALTKDETRLASQVLYK